MAITYVGGKVAGTAGQGGGSISLTSGWTGGSGGNPLENDLVVVTVSVGTAARQPTIAIATPSGYTPLTVQRTTATTYDTNVQTCYKFMGSTPDTTVTIPASGNNADGISYSIQVFRGVDTTTPMDATATYATGSGTNNRPNGAAITPVTAGAWIVVCGGGAAATGTTLYTAAALSGFLTANGPDTNDGTVGAGYYTGWASGAYDPAVFGGGSVNANNSWGCTTLALRPMPPDVTVSVTGVAGTGSVGSVTAAGEAIAAVTGVAGTGGVGSVTATGEAIAAVTGVAATGAVGSVVVPQDTTYIPWGWGSYAWGEGPWGGSRSVYATGYVGQVTVVLAADVDVAVTGSAGTGAVGTVVAVGDANVAVTGVAGTGGVGSVTATGDANVAVTGVAGTGGVGSVTATGDANVAVTGSAGTGAVGTAVAAGDANVSVTGVAGTGDVGTVTVVSDTSVIVEVTGVAGTGGVGSVTATGDANVPVTGVAGAGAVGSVTVSIGSNTIVTVTGVYAIGYVGAVAVWTVINPDQPAGWIPVVDGQSPGWGPITDTQIPGWNAVVDTQGSGWTPVVDAQTPDWNN